MCVPLLIGESVIVFLCDSSVVDTVMYSCDVEVQLITFISQPRPLTTVPKFKCLQGRRHDFEVASDDDIRFPCSHQPHLHVYVH